MEFTGRCQFCGAHSTILRFRIEEHDSHKRVCNSAKEALQKPNQKETALRAVPNVTYFDADHFSGFIGNFFDITQTFEYMRWRLALVEAIIRADTHQAIWTAIHHLSDISRLSIGENLVVRDLVPHLMLRVNEDQWSHDFVKCSATTGQPGHLHWGNTNLPYLYARSADPFEANLASLVAKDVPLSQAVAATLLKVKLFLDLTGVQNSAILVAKVPRELVQHIQQFVPQSRIISGNFSIMRGTHENRKGIIRRLKMQIAQLFRTVHACNPYFWPAILNPDRHLLAGRDAYSGGFMREMQVVLQFSYASWKHTPGALELVKRMFEEGPWTPKVAAAP